MPCMEGERSTKSARVSSPKIERDAEIRRGEPIRKIMRELLRGGSGTLPMLLVTSNEHLSDVRIASGAASKIAAAIEMDSSLASRAPSRSGDARGSKK